MCDDDDENKKKSPQVCLWDEDKHSLYVHSPLTLSILNLHCRYHRTPYLSVSIYDMNKKLIQILCLFYKHVWQYLLSKRASENDFFLLNGGHVKNLRNLLWEWCFFYEARANSHYEIPEVADGLYKSMHRWWRRRKIVRNNKNNTSFE